MHAPSGMTRRSFVGGTAACLAPFAFARSAAAATPFGDHGRVDPPVAIPDIAVVQQDGVVARLPSLVLHRATALQFMFTSCTVTCPIEGAIFARAQSLLRDQVARGIQLLSFSVDPKRDTPVALSAWLQKFHARPGWIGVAPRVEDFGSVRALGGRASSPTDNHSTQVLIINRSGLLVWRTFELPEAEEVAAILQKV